MCESFIYKAEMRHVKTTFLAATVLMMTGCATIISGTSQQVHVKVVDENNSLVKNTTCAVSNGGSEFEFSSNPTTITVNKSEPLTIKCRAKGYTQKGSGLGKSFDSVAIVNVLFWPGFIVDGVSGAMQKYPSHAVIEMQKN